MLALQRLRDSMTAQERQELEDKRLQREQLRAMWNFDGLNRIARQYNGNFGASVPPALPASDIQSKEKNKTI